MSGLEAVHWANRYPDEVNAIIGLDPAMPPIYEIHATATSDAGAGLFYRPDRSASPGAFYCLESPAANYLTEADSLPLARSCTGAPLPPTSRPIR